MIKITERGTKDTSFGPAVQLKVFSQEYRPLTWREVCDAFNESYPGRWAIQVFPPSESIVDAKNVYHLWMLAEPPKGIDLRHPHD